MRIPAWGAFLLLPLLLSGCERQHAPQSSSSAPKAPAPSGEEASALLPDGTAIRLMLARTPEEQERGLMFVESLPDDRGMLFLYAEDGIRPFWMKNCRMALDLVWLSADGTVVDITREAPPCMADPCPYFEPSAPCRYTLEVRGGLAAERGLKAGDRITLRGLSVPATPPA